MADGIEISGLESLRSHCSEPKISPDSRFLLISSVDPQSICASAVLSRSILRSGGSVHVTFTEPVSDPSPVAADITKNDTFTILCVGLSPVRIKNSKVMKKSILLAPSDDVTDVHTLGVSYPVIPTSLAFALEHLTVNQTDCQIAAVGITSLMNLSDSLAPEAQAIVDYALANKLVIERPEFLLYGSNFLPVRDSLRSSIHPYLEGISGEPATCEAILDEADIPRAQRSRPITSLKKDERQRITSALVMRIDPVLLTKVIGANYEVPSEKKDGALRWTSGIRALSLSAWSRREFGVVASVWMGDRARSLRALLDGYTAHANSVINTLHDIIPSINEGAFTATDLVSIMTVSNGNAATLSEIGRILLTRSSIKSRFILLQSSETIVVAWRPSEIQLASVLSVLYSDNLHPNSTSPTSIAFDPSSNQQMIVASLEKVEVSN